MTKINMQELTQDFTDYLNEFHSYQQPYDDLMDAEIYEQFAAILRKQSKWGYFKFSKDRPHFSPSSAGKSDRELYEKVRKSPRDEQRPVPHRRRWTALGEQIGGMIQREIMLAERHYEKFTGKPARYRFARNEDGAPLYEQFTKVMHEVDYNGEKFAIYGLGDGILEYIAPDGEVFRIGLEIKSKQTSYAETGERRMKAPKDDHRLQTVCYSEMYGLDYFFVIYVNSSKKAWYMDADELAKAPDFRVFGYEVTKADRDEVLTKFARVTKAAREGNPPPFELDAWKFCDYKTHIARTMSEKEFETLKVQAIRMQNSSLPDWKKRQYAEAVDSIKEVRDNCQKN